MKKKFAVFITFDSMDQANYYLEKSNKQDFFLFSIANEGGLYYANNATNKIVQILEEKSMSGSGYQALAEDGSGQNLRFTDLITISLDAFNSVITIQDNINDIVLLRDNKPIRQVNFDMVTPNNDGFYTVLDVNDGLYPYLFKGPAHSEGDLYIKFPDGSGNLYNGTSYLPAIAGRMKSTRYGEIVFTNENTLYVFSTNFIFAPEFNLSFTNYSNIKIDISAETPGLLSPPSGWTYAKYINVGSSQTLNGINVQPPKLSEGNNYYRFIFTYNGIEYYAIYNIDWSNNNPVMVQMTPETEG